MNPIYNVPLIPQNLSREETMIQIAESLNYLQDVTTDLFAAINRRIQKNQDHLSHIKSRVAVAQAKIQKLSGAKTATQIFSASKYPAADTNKMYESIFAGKSPLLVRRFSVDYENFPQKSHKDEGSESLLLYHVKVREEKKKASLSGLGQVPREVKSVNDLLLFNSGKNPYENFELEDTLQGAAVSKKEEVSNPSEIGEAPTSIRDKTGTLKAAKIDFSYTPNLGEVPALDVPMHLPDLPGIADDLLFNTDLGPGIAPSALTSPDEEFKRIDGDFKRVGGDPKRIDGGLEEIHGGLKRIDGDLRGIDGDLKGIDGDLKGIDGDLRGIYGDLKGIDGDVTRIGELEGMDEKLKQIDQSDGGLSNRQNSSLSLESKQCDDENKSTSDKSVRNEGLGGNRRGEGQGLSKRIDSRLESTRIERNDSEITSNESSRMSLGDTASGKLGEEEEKKGEGKLIEGAPKLVEKGKKEKVKAVEDDARASLMDAIRKAGGKMALKSSGSRPVEGKKSNAPTGDLMSDLYAKLSMRRKGISGAKNESGNLDAGSTLLKISTMIPPPPIKNDLTDSTNTDDQEWDD